MKARFLIPVVLVVFLVGCKDEIDTAIGKLGGTPAEQQQAINDIAISGKDPLPKLRKAIADKKLPSKVRASVAKLLGNECEKAADASRCSIGELKGALPGAEEEVQLAIVAAIALGKSKESVAALREVLDGEAAAAAKAAEAELDKMAEAKILRAEDITDPAALSRKEKLLKEALAFNPKNRRVAGLLASLYSSQGMEGDAKELFDSGGEYVRAFRVLGPFETGQAAPFPLKGEIDLDATYPGKRRDAAWFDFDQVPESGEADFRRDRRTKIPDAVYYAVFTVNTKKGRDVLLTVLGSDVDVIWVNGDKLKYEPPAGENGGESRTETALEKGDNRVCLQVSSRKCPRFAVRLSGRKSDKLEGVEYGL